MLVILLKKYGAGDHNEVDNKSIYECAHDWISQGHNTTFGIIKYYEAYYD